MSTFVISLIILLIILIIVIIDIVKGGKMNYPLLKNRSSDIKSWRFDDIDVTITAAYLEVIAGAFSLEDVFKLQPTDSLENLYNSYYKKNIFGVDDMELEQCAINYEKLCQTADIEFAYQSSIYDQLKTIVEYRNNQPVTADEAACLGIKMIFLPLLKADAADKGNEINEKR